MINTAVDIEEFLNLAKEFPVIDVRSPGEFGHGHIPVANNIPLFDNDERTKVGTTYKNVGRQAAIKIGLELVGPKLSSFVKQVEEIIAKHRSSSNSHPALLVHCWRGGMRSANFAWLLNLSGIKTFTLRKGYKAYRNFVLKDFERNAKIIILGGTTGSGKTEILKELQKEGEQIIDLEGLAHHKGSSFGAIGQEKQPTQETFENEISEIWNSFDFSKRIWLEDEAKSIGKNFIPEPLWKQMKEAPIVRINVPKEERIKRLVSDYGKFDKKLLEEAIMRITKRLGPQHAKTALQELGKANLATVADIMLVYYDKSYNYNHENRERKNIFQIDVEKDEPSLNAEKAMVFVNKNLMYEYERRS